MAMKTKIKKILLETLKSAYDGGDIDDGGIMGGDKAVDQLYDLFVDEIADITITTKQKDEYEEHMKSTNSARIDMKNEFSPNYFNSKTGETQKLFDILLSVYGVRCSETITIGDKGCSVSMNVAASSEEEAITKVMKNKEFTKHIRMKDFDKKYLSVYRPVGNYVIGEVKYYEGDERL